MISPIPPVPPSDPDLYRYLLEQTPDAAIFVDVDGIVRFWNAGAEAIFGFKVAEARGATLNFIIPENLRDAHWAGFSAAIRAGHTKHNEGPLTTRAMTKDRGKIYVSLSFSIIRDSTGLVLGALAIGRDITVHYTSERESKNRIAKLEKDPPRDS